jgi:hypothetical protein
MGSASSSAYTAHPYTYPRTRHAEGDRDNPLGTGIKRPFFRRDELPVVCPVVVLPDPRKRRQSREPGERRIRGILY